MNFLSTTLKPTSWLHLLKRLPEMTSPGGIQHFSTPRTLSSNPFLSSISRKEPPNHATRNRTCNTPRIERTPRKVRSLTKLITPRKSQRIRNRQTQRDDYFPISPIQSPISVRNIPTRVNQMGCILKIASTASTTQRSGCE
jgi:hypothetical protein